MNLPCVFPRCSGRVPAVAWLLAVLEVSALAAPLTKGPYLQAPGPEGITIMWESAVEESGELRYGEGDRLDRTVGPIRPTRVANAKVTFYVYEAVLAGLKPGTAYRYEARIGSDSSGRRQFRTFNREAAQVTFIAYGDTRTNPEKHAAVAAHFRRHEPEFILHSGDLVAKGTEHERWANEFFDPLKGVIDEVPMLPSIGNHEQDGVNYLAYFHQPGDQRFFYSRDIGPVHVVTLDYRSTKPTDEQFAFVAADLRASRAPWKVVLLHAPMFNFGGHASLWGHEHYLPLFRETKVDLVLAGHSHLYERFKPLGPKGQPDAWLIQHVTTGGGGAPLAAAIADPSLVVAEKVYHFVWFRATRDQLEARAIDIDGREFDRFALRKEKGRQPAAYRAEAYAEEDVVAAVKRLPPKVKKAAAAAEAKKQE
ncbi:MAG: metallophosphoesterase family protein [Verrucomicrobia bacterium]|nr:metallophosphoesterase family protein [Verrucomicrobiota bacterium]